jgi:phosphoglycerate dehydrogenase-like enzyme
MPTIKLAVLDDYQHVARGMADWSAVERCTEMTFFHDHVSDPEEIVRRLAPFDVLCVMRERTPLPRPLLERLPNLKLVVSTGARNASIDLAAATELGVAVCHTRYIGHGAAELTWALILAAVKHVSAESSSVRGGGWQKRIGGELKGRTLGIVGLGNLGGAVARFGRAFDMNIVAWSTNLTDSKAAEHGAQLVSKQQLFQQSDIVTVHLVFAERTRSIIGTGELGLMKPTAWLVNTSRGPLIDETALIEILKNEAIAGAALDVFDVEPLPANHPFRSLPNVIATPHIGYVTQDTYRLFYRDTVECVLAWLDGKPVRRMN